MTLLSRRLYAKGRRRSIGLAFSLLGRRPGFLIAEEFLRCLFHLFEQPAVISSLVDGGLQFLAEFRQPLQPLGNVFVEHFHGAATRVPVTATAFPHRREGYNLVLISQWLSPAMNDACIAWARESFAALSPHLHDRRYSNYMGHDEPTTSAAAAFGVNHARLRTIKAK